MSLNRVCNRRRPVWKRAAARASSTANADWIGVAVAGAPKAGALPVMTTVFRAGERRLTFVSTVTQFGGASDATVEDLRIETMHPLDDDTRDVLRRPVPAAGVKFRRMGLFAWRLEGLSLDQPLPETRHVRSHL